MSRFFHSKKQYLSLGLLVGFILLYGGLLYIKINVPIIKEDKALLLSRISGIENQLISLQAIIKKVSEKPDAAIISPDFSQLEKTIQALRRSEEKELNKLLTTNKEAVTDKLDTMLLAMKELDKKQHPIKYLSVKALPFTLISIDSIQQVSVATVSYDYKTIPLETKESLAGWTVLKVDFSKQQIEFENKNKERVIASLNHEEGPHD